MDIKLLLLDLDDTLLNSKGELSGRTETAVRAAVDKGVTVAIASGRMHASIMPYVERLNTHGPVVSYNGALIRDSVTARTIYSNPLPLDLAKKVTAFAKEKDIFCQFYTEQDYFFEKHCALSEAYFKSTGIKGIALGGNLEGKIKEAPPKILLIDFDIEKITKVLGELKKEFGNALYITRSKGQYIEIMNKNVNKGAALLKMCELFSINPKNSMAIGDGLNDLEMIKNAGTGVAVEKAADELKAAADIVCGSADDDGPARIIEEIVLCGRQFGGNYGKGEN